MNDWDGNDSCFQLNIRANINGFSEPHLRRLNNNNGSCGRHGPTRQICSRSCLVLFDAAVSKNACVSNNKRYVQASSANSQHRRKFFVRRQIRLSFVCQISSGFCVRSRRQNVQGLIYSLAILSFFLHVCSFFLMFSVS